MKQKSTQPVFGTAPGLILSLHSDDTPITGADAIKKAREIGDQMLTSVNSFMDILEEPFKGKFLQVKNDINTMLASLKPSDQAPAALESNAALRQVMYALANAQSMMKEMTSMVMTRASVTDEVTKAIEAQTKEGKLFTKANLDQMVADAKTAAETSIRKTIEDEGKLAKARTEILTKAGLPVPDVKHLVVGDEAAFVARQGEVTARVNELKPFGLKADRVLSLAWDTDKPAYDATVNLLKDVCPAKGAAARPAGGGGGSPFIKPGSTTDTAAPLLTAAGTKVLGMC